MLKCSEEVRNRKYLRYLHSTIKFLILQNNSVQLTRAKSRARFYIISVADFFGKLERRVASLIILKRLKRRLSLYTALSTLSEEDSVVDFFCHKV